MFLAIHDLLKSNPLIAGGAGMAVMGWVVMQLKSAPLRLWQMIQDQFSVTVTVYSEDPAYRMVNVWMAKHPSVKRSRRLGLAVWYNPRKDDDDHVLTPGEGLHLLRTGWRFYLVHRRIEAQNGPAMYGADRKQTISITVLGRSQEPIRALLAQVVAVKEDHDTVPVLVWAGGAYMMVERRLKRPMDTVYIDSAMKADIIDDVQKFVRRRAWYADRAIPYRRGYCLEGPPGTGKTSLIFAIASLIEKPVHLINPAGLDNDNQLQQAVNAAGSGIVVIEDIDSLRATEDRELKVNARQAALAAAAPLSPAFAKGRDSSAPAPLHASPLALGDASTSGVTLSGILNAIDGLGARDGRLLFITSNHADMLDAALLRPGRVDRRFHLGYAGETEALEMFNRFFPDCPIEKLPDDIQEALPISPAALQNRLLGLAETLS